MRVRAYRQTNNVSTSGERRIWIMNEQVNVHESTASVTFVSAKKRKIRMPFDMVICLVLVFVLVSALTALFVVRRHADVVIGGMQAVEVIDRTNTEGVPVTFESTVEEDGSISTNLHYSAVDTLGASSSSYELPEEVRNVVSVQKIGEAYVLTHADGTTTTFTDDNFGYVEVDLDEVMGALPAVSEEDAIDRAMNAAGDPVKVALAANVNTNQNNDGLKTCNSWQYVYSGGSARSGEVNGGGGMGDAHVYFMVGITTSSTWYKYIKRNTGYMKGYGYFDPQAYKGSYGNNPRVASYGCAWSNSNGDYNSNRGAELTNNGSVNFCYHTRSVVDSQSHGNSDKEHDAQISAGMTNISLQLRHTSSNCPTTALSGSYAPWLESRTVSVTATEGNYGPWELDLYYANSATAGVDAKRDDYTGLNSGDADKGAQTRSTSAAAYSRVRARARGWNNRYSSSDNSTSSNAATYREYSAQTLQLDGGKPVIDAYKIVSSNTATTEVGMTNSTQLWFYLKVHDTGGNNRVPSGVSAVEIKNTTITTGTNTWNNGTTNTRTTGVALNTVNNTNATEIWIPVPGASANGSWTVTIRDQVGTSHNVSLPSNYVFKNYDRSTPKVSNIQVNGAGTVTSGWTRQGLNLSFDVTDTWGPTYWNDPCNAALASATFSYTINGNSYDLALTCTKNGTVSGRNRLYSYTTNGVLMYDFYTLSAASLVVKDTAGNQLTYAMSLADASIKTTGTRTLSGTDPIDNTTASQSVTINARLDTVAPEVTAVTPDNNSWTNNKTGLFYVIVTAKDYTYSGTESGAYFYSAANKYYNNGSGLKTLSFYADAARSKPLNVAYTSDGTISGNTVTFSSWGVNSKSPRIGFNYDTKNSAFGGNVYVFAQDQIGNCSWGGTVPTVTANNNNLEAKPINSNYPKDNSKTWLFPGTAGVTATKSYATGIKRDTYTPQVIIKSGSTIIASSNGYGGTTENYIFPWTDATSQAYTVIVYYGSSGGTLTISGEGGSTETISELYGSFTDFPFSGAGSAGSGEKVSVSSSKAASASAVASKSYSKSYSNATQGEYKQKIQFKNKGNEASKEITLTFRLDHSEPTVHFLGFVPSEAGYTYDATTQKSNLIDSSYLTNWLYPNAEAGFRAVFQVSDGAGSGVVRDKTEDKVKNYGVVTSSETGGKSTKFTSEYTRYYYDIGDDITQNVQTVGTKVENAGEVKLENGAYVAKAGAPATARMEMVYTNKSGRTYRQDIQTTYPRYVDQQGIYVVEYQMFSREDFAKLTSNGYKLYDSTAKKGDVDEGTYIRYKVGVSDFLGHVGYAYTEDANRPNFEKNYNWEPENTRDNKSSGGSSSILRWKIDPFPPKINSVTWYQWKDTSAVPDTPVTNITSYANLYDMTTYEDNKEDSSVYPHGATYRKNGWAKNSVVAVVNVSAGLSGYSARYYYTDLASTYSTNADDNYKTSWYDTHGFGDIKTVGADAIYNKETAWLVFDRGKTRNIGVRVYVASPTKMITTAGTVQQETDPNNSSLKIDSVKNDTKYNDTTGPYIVKQDITDPIIESVFLSEYSDYETAKGNRMLSFNATKNGSNYSFTLDTSNNYANSPLYNASLVSAGYRYAYSAVKPYVYIRVTDKTGNLMGSGIKSVSFNNVATQYCKIVDQTSEYWRTRERYVYEQTGKSHANGFNLSVSDNQNNTASTTYGYEDSTGYRMLPIYDPYAVYVRLAGTSASNYLSNVGNARFPKEDGYESTASENNNSYFEDKTVYSMNGRALTNANFMINVEYSVGISGLDIYIRRKNYDDLSTDSALTYGSAGNVLPAGYDLAAKGWSYYNGSTWAEPAGNTIYSTHFEKDGDAFGSYIMSDFDNTDPRNSERKKTIDFILTSVKERYELLAVSGTGKYYAIDLGALYIDTEAPHIHNETTFFTVDGDNDTAEANYNDLQVIWTEQVGQDYTNGSVNIYYYIVDAASGIADGGVYLNGEEADTLTKVTVANVPVWTINGVKTSARRVTDVKPNVTNYGGNFALNGYVVRTLDDKNQPIAYSASPEIGMSTATLTFYRWTATESGAITICAVDAIDENPNKTDSNNVRMHSVAIDKAKITVTVAGRTSDDDTEWKYTGEKFTNQSVTVKVEIICGASGFGGLEFTKKNSLENPAKTTSVSISVPYFRKVGSDLFMYYYPKSSSTLTRAKMSFSTFGVDGFKVEGKADGFWYIKGIKSSYEINTDVYGAAETLKNYTWYVKAGSVECWFTQLNTDHQEFINVKDEYKFTAKNNVFDALSVGKTRPTGTNVKDNKGYNVLIDTEKPVINFASGNLQELASTSYWHALSKSVRISVEDQEGLSGIGKTVRSLSATEAVEKVEISYVVATDAEGNPTSVKSATFVKDPDGLYRAYILAMNADTGYQERDGLFFVDQYKEYTIKVEDDAGNVTTYSFTPLYDPTTAKITNLELKNSSGDPYIEYNEADNHTEVAAQWVKDVAANTVNWADDNVYAYFTVTYGRSGYTLQYRSSYQKSGLKTGAWTNIVPERYTEDKYKVTNTVDNGNGTFTDVVRFTIGDLEEYVDESGEIQTRAINNLYYYYLFRAVSKAIDTELNVYKKYDKPNEARATESNDSTKISVDLEAYEQNDDHYKVNGVAQTTTTLALSAGLDSGLIAIDKELPTVGTKLAYKKDANTYPNYGTEVKVDGVGTGNWTVADGVWTNKDVRMELTISSDSGFASGNAIFYRYTEIDDQTGTVTWSPWTMITQNRYLYQYKDGKWTNVGSATTNFSYTAEGLSHTDNAGTVISSHIKDFKYTLSTSQNNVMYEMYTQTGAGKKSEVYRFGTAASSLDTRYGIKIDKTKPVVERTAGDTFTEFNEDPMAIQSTLAEEYRRSTEYLTSNSDVGFTYKNSVVIRVQISNVGYSGVKVYVDKGERDGSGNAIVTLLDTITYEQFNAQKDAIGSVYRYYYVNKNGKSTHIVYADSIAGEISDRKSAYANIDNSRPVLYVTAIEGTKATNWGWTNNLYTEAEYYYVSALNIVLEVGKVEKDGTYSKGTYSDYTIEYAYKGSTGGWSAWAVNNATTIRLDGFASVDPLTGRTVDNIVRGNQYMFRITSQAGLSYVVGDQANGNDVLDNQGRTLFDAATLKTKAMALDENPYVTGHVQADGKGDKDDGSYQYKFYVDSTVYSYEYKARVDLGNGSFDENTDKLTTYEVRVADKDQTFTRTTATRNFHRGDLLEIEYTAHFDGKDENGYDFYQNYTKSTAGNRVIYHTVGNSMLNVPAAEATGATIDTRTNANKEINGGYERTGTFRVQFVADNIYIIGEFLAEVDVTYGADVFYAQTNALQMKTTGTATYEYMDGSDERSVNVSLAYKYFAYDNAFTSAVETADPRDVGAYYVQTYVPTSGGAFRVTGTTEYKDYVIKYFSPVEGENYFRVRNEYDFTFVDNAYYDLAANGTVDRDAKTYLDANFRLESNLSYDARPELLTGTYKGVFDGNGYWMMFLYKETITSDYGLFESVKGTVKNMTIRFADVVTVRAETPVNVGFVTKTIASGGKVENVAVIADVVIDELAPSSNFGAIAAASAGKIGGTDPLFTDVRITNRGAEMQDVNVSAVVGHVKEGASFSNVYAFGEIELYNVTNVNAGMLYGQIDAGTYGSVSETYYLNNNVFVNKSTVSNASSCTAVASLGTALDYDGFMALDDSWLSGSATRTSAMVRFDNTYNVSYKAGGVSIRTEILSRLLADFGYAEWAQDELRQTLESATAGATAEEAAIVTRYFYGICADMDRDTDRLYDALAATIGNGLTDEMREALEEERTSFYMTRLPEMIDLYGTGASNCALRISSTEHLAAMNGYMNLFFLLTSDLDMARYETALAVTKVFNGSLSGNGYVKLTNFSGNTETYENEVFGLFGQLNGSVSNLVFDEIDLDVTYSGCDPLYAGIVAGKAYGNARIANVMFIGTEKITATSDAAVYVGGVVGRSEGANIYDVFNVNNLSVNASKVYMGGIAGESNGVALNNKDHIVSEREGTVFLLGRAEASGEMLTVGAAIGKVTDGSDVTGGSRVYTILNNLYENGQTIERKPIGTGDTAYGVQTVDFNYGDMRTAGFASVGGSAFAVAFDNYYPLDGLGSEASPFIIRNEEDFKNINLILYANYRIDGDEEHKIEFTDFKTIGEGLTFSGVLKGYVGDDISAENGKVVSLINVTAPLVYYNAGSISELSVNVEYEATVGAGETFRYGAIAIYNEGEIKNVTVAGNVAISAVNTQDTTMYVSGFVAESYGGTIDTSKLQNSISALSITINGGGIAYVGGYAAIVTKGQATFSYGIATGTINVTGVRKTYAGLLVGVAQGECEWILGEAATIDYTYTITIDGEEIPKYDENGDPLTENFCDLEFSQANP